MNAIGTAEMSWGEAFRQTEIIAADPSTQLGARLSGWSHPASYGDLIAMDLYDLTRQVVWAEGGGKGPRPDPYPRPWGSRKRHKATPDPSLTQEEIIAALRNAGHTAPLPVR